MNKYTCENYRPVTAESIGDAAMEFAGRAARREYGRRAYAANCVAQSWTEDHTMVQYQAFIGTKCDGGTAGKNITFSVYLQDEAWTRESTFKALIGRTVRFNGYEGKVVKVSEDALTLRRITPGIDGPIAMEFEAPIRKANAWMIIE